MSLALIVSPIGRIFCGQKAARYLRDDVAPEERRVDHADRFRCPVEFALFQTGNGSGNVNHLTERSLYTRVVFVPRR